MVKQIKRLIILIILLIAALPTPLARAEGGWVIKPYWTFRTDVPVTHLQTGDINDDGVPEIVMLTDDNFVQVLENDGTLAWRYQVGDKTLSLLVADFDNDGQTAEIFVGSSLQDMLLSEVERPAWVNNYAVVSTFIANTATDLNVDGQPEIIAGYDIGIGLINGQTGEYQSDFEGTAAFRNSSTDLSQTSGFRSNFELTVGPVIDIWAGEIDGDGRPEIVPNLTGGFEVSVREADLAPAWRKRFEHEIALVRPGDVDGDGLAEIAVLTSAWELLLLESDGALVWQQPVLTSTETEPIPNPRQLLLQDLDGDGRQEIILLAGATVQAFDGEGQPLWQRQFQKTGNQAAPPAEEEAVKVPADIQYRRGGVLQPCPLGQQQIGLLATIPGQTATHLLAADGQRLAEYLTGPTTGALACADLNDDGQPEIIIGAESGLQVFGLAPHVTQTVLWRSAELGALPAALYLADLDADGRDEIVTGSVRERVFALAGDGRTLWDILPGGVPVVLSIGDVDGDGRRDVAFGTGIGEDGRQIRVLADRHITWAVEVGLRVDSIAIWEQASSSQAKIIVGVTLLDNSKAVLLLTGAGKNVWRYKVDEVVTAISGDGDEILAGDHKGRVYRLTADGKLIGTYDLGTEVIGLQADLAATSEGKIYRLAGDSPTLLHDFGETLTAVQLGQVIAAGFAGGRFSAIVDGETIWQGMVTGEITGIAVGDVNGDGQLEFALSTDDGRIDLFGDSFDQPLLLTTPLLAETRTGYTYSVNANDPEGEAVPVVLEIWDPTEGIWLPQPAQALAEGQDQGRLAWQVAEPFDMWDSGQESRFRFSYGDGQTQHITPEIPGPFNIPTIPWSIYYGQRAGLVALILLVPALGLALYRRQRAYQRSPMGRAESLLKQLQSYPDESLSRLHTVSRTEPELLAHLPGLAGEAGETALAELSEGFHLNLTRPEVAGEGLRAIIASVARLPQPKNGDGPGGELTRLYTFCLQALEANTVSRILALRLQLNELTELLSRPNCALVELASPLADLERVAQSLHNYQRVETIDDKVAYLAQAIELLGRFDREFQTSLPQPERNILGRIAATWLGVATNALRDLQGRAQLEVSLKTRRLLNLEQTTLSLELVNTGRSPASNINITLLPGEGYKTPGDSSAQVNILPAGGSSLVELPFSTTAEQLQFRVEFALTFDDRERSGKTIAFADQVQLLQPSAEFQPIPNPYAPGTPLREGSPIFFGRDDLFRFIEENMAGLARQNILVLIGQRRMGKTSFLQQLSARLGSDYTPVYIDGQSLGIDSGMDNFFYDLSLAIIDALANQDIVIGELEPEAFAERPSGTFERTFLPAVFEAIGQRQLLLLFDEFEELEMRVASGKLEPTIFPFFRHLMQHHRQLGFIFVGTHRLETLSSDYWSIFFNIALYKHVTFLTESAALSLITEPVAGYGLLYDDLALDKMLRVTAGHPYFLQLTCHALVNHVNRVRQSYVTIQDVNDVLKELVELGEAHFAFLWEQSGPPEQLILAVLTRLLGQEATVTAAQVAELLVERGVAMELPSVTEPLRQLVERDVIREVRGQPPRYEFKVELVRQWIERYKALGRVIEDIG